MIGSRRYKALLLEDEDLDAAVTMELLKKTQQMDFDVTHSKVLKDAAQHLSRSKYDVALIDLNVADSQGLETVTSIVRANPHVPLIVLSGDDDVETAMKSLRIGAQDFMPKSELNNRTLQRVICYAMERKDREASFINKAHFDSLTGLANRALLYERWCRSVLRSAQAGHQIGLIITDIDGFAIVNQRYGQAAGDALLKHFAERLQHAARQTDIVARLGGDEFIIAVECVESKAEIDTMRDDLIRLLAKDFTYNGEDIPFSVSIGGTTSDPAENEDLFAVIQRADAEMREFKSNAATTVVAANQSSLRQAQAI